MYRLAAAGGFLTAVRMQGGGGGGVPCPSCLNEGVPPAI